MPGGTPCCFDPIETAAAFRSCFRCLASKCPTTECLGKMSEQAGHYLLEVLIKSPMRFREGVSRLHMMLPPELFPNDAACGSVTVFADGEDYEQLIYIYRLLHIYYGLRAML